MLVFPLTQHILEPNQLKECLKISCLCPLQATHPGGPEPPDIPPVQRLCREAVPGGPGTSKAHRIVALSFINY